MIGSAYLAAEDFQTPLAEELRRRGITISRWHGRLALSPDSPVQAARALDIWTEPRDIEVPSIRDAADAMRGNAAQLGSVRGRSASADGPDCEAAAAGKGSGAAVSGGGAGLASWGVDVAGPHRLLASPVKSSPFVNGACHFVEDHAGPPSRACLKLWEALVRLGRWPKAGERCPDLGASPGG